MKISIKSIFIILFGLAFFNVSAQTTDKVEKKKVKKIETVFFKVEGVCNMCKKRIENAALIKGVKMVEWTKETQILKVIYSSKKTSLEKIHAAVADSGHDTTVTKAKDEVYAELPGCCKYRDGVKVH